MRELLAQSLLAWQLPGTVRAETEGVIVLCCNSANIRVEAAADGLPFRWMVTINGRKRGAVSLIAVLRQVRTALDPGYAINRVRMAPLPVVQ